MKTLIEEIVGVLEALGYSDLKCREEEKYYKIYFRQCDQYMTERHENVVRALAESKLMEFFWQSSVQSIYIRK